MAGNPDRRNAIDTWDAYRSRRNVRRFEPRPLPAAGLDRILEAGRRAPSARNGQPWDFVVVTRPAALAELAGVWRGAGHVAGSAATIVVTAPADADPASRYVDFDVGQAVMAMCVVAADLGIGSGHSAVGDQDRLRGLLGIPGDRRGVCLLALGFPADRPLAPLARLDRRAFNDVVHRERW